MLQNISSEPATDALSLLRWQIFQETISVIQEKTGSIREAFEENNGPYPVLQRIEKVVTKQCLRGT